MNSLKSYTVFIVSPSRELSRYIETKVPSTCFYLIAFFKKAKESPCLNFCIIFHEKYFPTLCFISWPNVIVWLSLLLDIFVSQFMTS